MQWASNIAQWFAKLPVIGSKSTVDRFFLDMMVRGAKLGGIGRLRQAENGLLLTPNQPGDYLGQRVNTASGKVELAPADLVERAKQIQQVFDEDLANARQLKLIQKRERFTHNSWAHNVAAFVKGDRNTNYLYIHSVDASARSLADGAIAKVSANGRSIEVPVKIDDDMMVGTVSVPHGWGHQQAKGLRVANQTVGVNVNIITPDGPGSIEPGSGMSHMNGVIVDVSAA